MVSVVLGLIMVAGGLSGKLVMRGTTSSTPITIIGAIVMLIGLARIVSSRSAAARSDAADVRPTDPMTQDEEPRE